MSALVNTVDQLGKHFFFVLTNTNPFWSYDGSETVDRLVGCMFAILESLCQSAVGAEAIALGLQKDYLRCVGSACVSRDIVIAPGAGQFATNNANNTCRGGSLVNDLCAYLVTEREAELASVHLKALTAAVVWFRQDLAVGRPILRTVVDPEVSCCPFS